MGHESTDTKDTQDTTKSPQHTQQAHEFCSRPPSRLHACQQLQPWQAVSFVSVCLGICQSQICPLAALSSMATVSTALLGCEPHHAHAVQAGVLLPG